MSHPNRAPIGLAVSALLALIALCGACDRAEPEPPRPNQPAEATPDALPPGQRIVSFVPALTEIAFDMGLGPRIVGVSDFATWPPEPIKALPRVGGLVNPNLERTLALTPDLLLASPTLEAVRELGEAQKIPVVAPRTESIEDIYAAYAALGEATGERARAKEAAEALRRELEALKGATKATGDARPRVLLVVGRDPGSLKGLYAAGPGSFLDELLVLAGGRNALPKTESLWPAISKEYVLAHPPEWILEFNASPTADPEVKTREAREAWAAMPSLKAVKAGRVRGLTGAHLLLPGPRVAQTVRAIQVILGEGR
ncbi:MAG: hypothetical protein CMH57_05135 [Myxococcales bacterium]|nr:hypothetical protein [Myxococcales bacterium]